MTPAFVDPDGNSAGPDAATGSAGDQAGGRRRLPGVWQNQAFLLLWAGQTVSTFGSYVTTVAVPLLAIVSLHASITDMGLLATVIRLPFLLYLAAGVWVDRSRRRPVLITTDLGRGILLLSIPVAAVTGFLTLPFLLVVVFAVMVLSVWFDIAYLSYVPALVERKALITANTIMETSNSAAQIAGTSLGGFLVQLVTAPVAILADSLSFLISAAAVWRIRKPEPPLPAKEGSGVRDVVSSIATGVRFVLRDRILAPLALALGTYSVFLAAEVTLYVFYLAHDLRLGAGLIGLTLAAAGPGAVAGSALAAKAQRTLGVAGAIITALTLFAATAWLIPLAPKDRAVAVPMLMVAQFLMAAGIQMCLINVITTRQSIAPPELLGRVTASFRFMVYGMAPVGSVLGGLLGATLGARGGLFAAVAGLIIPPVIVFASPVRRLRRLPGPDEPA